ncbi:MAG: hypothetical protein B6U94_01330 [Thermofilum sp. ex4484_79]|nr:MAG: hypothetical protein B6U94_01330 [Thermofilum sp. ex4484_79]
MRIKETVLDRGVYRVYGPVRIDVIDGEIFHLGRDVKNNEEIIVVADQTVAIFVKQPTKTRITFGLSGEIVPSSSEEEPIFHWKKIVEEIVANKYRVVMVLGETDSGKSTFSAFLANYAFVNGYRTVIIDSDVGQNDLGFPGCISSARLKKPLSWLRELSYENLFFVGSTTPANNTDSVIVGTRTLVEKEKENSDLIIINTDGWIDDIYARKYKTKLILHVKPDALVVMEGTGKSEYIVKFFGDLIPVYKAKTPSIRRIKKRARRRLRREVSYIDLFLNGVKRQIPLGKTPILGSMLFSGEKISANQLEILNKLLFGGVIYSEKYDKIGVLILKNENVKRNAKKYLLEIKKLLNVNRIIMLSLSDLVGVVVGLVGEKLEYIGVGVINKIDFRKNIIYLTTSLGDETTEIKGLVLGNIKIERDGTETRLHNLSYL